MYYQLRRKLVRLAKLLNYGPGEMYGLLKTKPFQDMADTLVAHYFPKSKSLEIRFEVRRLFLIGLVLGPIIQRQKCSMRLDMHKGHVLTWVRRAANTQVGRFYFSSWSEVRENDPQKLVLRLRELSVRDERFLREAKEAFEYNYTAEGWRGALANMIFDPIMFSKSAKGYCLRIGNVFYRLEKKRHAGSVDLRQTQGVIWDYAVMFRDRGYVEEKCWRTGKMVRRRKGSMELLLSDDRIDRFKQDFEAILNSQFRPEQKVIRLSTRIRDLLLDAKYARDCLAQLLELKVWIKEKVQRLRGTNRSVEDLGRCMIRVWNETETGSRHFIASPNFFWTPDTARPPKAIFIQYYNPKREVIVTMKKAEVIELGQPSQVAAIRGIK